MFLLISWALLEFPQRNYSNPSIIKDEFDSPGWTRAETITHFLLFFADLSFIVIKGTYKPPREVHNLSTYKKWFFLSKLWVAKYFFIWVSLAARSVLCRCMVYNKQFVFRLANIQYKTQKIVYKSNSI